MLRGDGRDWRRHRGTFETWHPELACELARLFTKCLGLGGTSERIEHLGKLEGDLRDPATMPTPTRQRVRLTKLFHREIETPQSRVEKTQETYGRTFVDEGLLVAIDLDHPEALEHCATSALLRLRPGDCGCFREEW